MPSPFAPLGRVVISWVNDMGAATIFFAKASLQIFRRNQASRILEQLSHIGAKTVGIVSLIGLFTGMVMALQIYYALAKFGAQGVLGSAVALGLIRELGPVMTAIMIIARAGSSMTAEIGILRISEQIDALYTMRIDPLGYLVSPRIAAAIVSFPLLTALFDAVGLIGGYFTGVMLLGVNSGEYLYQIQAGVDTKDVMGGFLKALIFAVMVSTICCFQGYFTHMRADVHGAKSVSLSTTAAVVLSCVVVLVGDYVITSFLI
ncbi:MAG: ABC transporter permease [Deltaproteobacteria bacterium RIFCSPHIGHO2_02_FULL_60_17]|nr:MAG: ABC transporter permease [Deltaproteobacteria bacterium RIFCSPHIGHO2_02_FULL_60_17]